MPLQEKLICERSRVIPEAKEPIKTEYHANCVRTKPIHVMRSYQNTALEVILSLDPIPPCTKLQQL